MMISNWDLQYSILLNGEKHLKNAPIKSREPKIKRKKPKHRRFELLSKADVDRILMNDVCGRVLNSGETKERKSVRNKTAALPAERTWERLFKASKCFVSL